MSRLKLYLNRNILWAGLIAVIIPLLVMLWLQYRSLSQLEETSADANKLALKNHLKNISNEIQSYYQSNAERLLSIKSSELNQERISTPGCIFQKSWDGAKHFFVGAFMDDSEMKPYFYNGTTLLPETKLDPSELLGVNLACAQLQILSMEKEVMDLPRFSVDEGHSENPIITKPIVDESNRVVGVAGIVVDSTYFKNHFLPCTVLRYLSNSFSDPSQENVIITMRDCNGMLVLATQEVNWHDDDMWVMPQFIFSNWRLGIRNRYLSPEQWARRNFYINLSLTILMTMVLIGGIFMAMQAASREIKLSQMKTDFVSNVSHELRTPLSSIRVFGEFLRLGRVTPEKIPEYGEYIETESRRLTQLINNILDFSKIESAQKGYQFERVDLAEVVDETLKTFDVRFKQCDFTIDFVAPESPLPQVFIDTSAIVQAFVNLLDNAVKYSGSSREISIQLTQENGWVAISVTDHGIGIPKEDREKIFEKFYRVSTGLVHDVKGSGLGLSIVKHIVEAHNGRVTVESEPNRGSTFTIYLPVDSSSLQQAAAPDSRSKAARRLGLADK